MPNYDNNDPTILEEGQAVAIEPFATNGEGIVNDCPYAYIFSFLQSKPFRMKNTQRMLQHIEKNYRYTCHLVDAGLQKTSMNIE